MEFALVVPIIFLLLLGVLQYGYHFWSLSTASAAARDAARRYAVGAQQTCTVQEAQNRARGAATGTVTVSGPPSSPQVGQVFQVTVGFQSLDLGLPLIPLPANGYVSQTAQSRIENVPGTPIPCD